MDITNKSLPSEGECLVAQNTENDVDISLGPAQTVPIQGLLVSFESVLTWANFVVRDGGEVCSDPLSVLLYPAWELGIHS